MVVRSIPEWDDLASFFYLFFLAAATSLFFLSLLALPGPAPTRYRPFAILKPKNQNRKQAPGHFLTR
jgi:hypothetical protein